MPLIIQVNFVHCHLCGILLGSHCLFPEYRKVHTEGIYFRLKGIQIPEGVWEQTMDEDFYPVFINFQINLGVCQCLIETK